MMSQKIQLMIGFRIVFILVFSILVVDSHAQGQDGVNESEDRWVELANHQNCYVGDIYVSPGEIVTWSADCTNGLARGYGSLIWLKNTTIGEKTREQNGLLREGKKHGRWIERLGQGSGLRIDEGFYEMGKKHGRWIERLGQGSGLRIDEGFYEMGKKHGRWIERLGQGSGLRIDEGFYEMGKKHGRWIERLGQGSGLRIDEGFYEMGKKHGRWIERLGQDDSSYVIVKTYVNDE